ncbi:YecA family protein [Marinospirillum perlucidum]|uniref:YecA/YgfB family protein n=1 Tax=Marinospirillum perlucidum TaxID=1982602 RepID=UPI000DF38D89|nr:YecA family protein [Marinospirillum perlucidum]
MQDHQPDPLVPLNEQELDQLDALLSPETDAEEEEEVNLFLALGYVTAQAISPQATPAEDWVDALLGNDQRATADLQALLSQAYRLAAQGFYQGAGIELPFASQWNEETEEFIADWCTGFMQAAFEQEEIWFNQQEQEVAELLLPIMALSGLFAEEEEFAEIEDNPELLQAFASQLPELLLDIYCQLNAPEEKKAPPASFPGGKKKKRRR